MLTRVTSIADLRARLDRARAAGQTVGFVPTMGYLHEGHRSLLDAARAANEVAVASVFVNPLQFGPTEDLAAYPRDLDRDLAMCEAARIDHVLHPSVEEMYPFGTPTLTTVTVASIPAAVMVFPADAAVRVLPVLGLSRGARDHRDAYQHQERHECSTNAIQ